ncbi:MAG: ACT domain-containing protein [Firmicutes bacterium]|nr:ACT domain-containing protein [Bacillota bacterium]
MSVQQVSVFLENKAGRLAEVSRILGKAGINIRALSVADTSDYGILRLIVDDPGRAVEVLLEKGFSASETEVLAVEVPDEPGGLAQVLEVLEADGVNVEYMYAFVEKASDDALVIFRVSEPSRARAILSQQGINVIPAEKLYRL